MKRKKITNLKNNKIIKETLNFLKQTKKFIKENKLVCIYVIGTLLNGIILRALTTKNILAISPIFADLFVTIFFASFYFVIKKKWRFLYLYTMIILSTLICIANIVYYHYYSSQSCKI